MATASPRVRPPAVAGRFYQADPHRCAAETRNLLEAPPRQALPALPETLHGGIVPHAGWICSGRLAALTIATLASHTSGKPISIVMTGSVHTMMINGPTLDSADAWQTPFGPVEIDQDLRRALAQLPDTEALDMAHQYEHSLEVPLPIIRKRFPQSTRIVPCLIPPHPKAARWGRAIGQVLARWPHPALMIASSDLTHYGPNYSFTPQGTGPDARRWALDVNDRRVLDRIVAMDADGIVPETHAHHNACGGGAIAATIAACAELGATRGYLLEHTDSTAQLQPLGHADADNSVGYASVVFG